MKRLFALILVGLLLAGCKSDAPVCDPFYGRTTIPPPPTGSVTGGAADLGYQPPPLVQTPAGSAPPVVQMPLQPSGQAATGQSSLQATAAQPSSPSGFAPNVSAPRPTSTAPSGSVGPRPVSPAPSSGPASPYTPPGGSYQYRGSATQGAAPLAPTQRELRGSGGASFTGVSATQGNALVDDRMPGPVDDAAGGGILAGRKPIIRTIEPRGGAVSGRTVDIMDLPKAP